MKLQRQLCNGEWIDENAFETFADYVLERESWYAERVGRAPMTTRDEVAAYLATGKTLSYDADWYANICDVDALRPARTVETVASDCGHECEKTLVMRSSIGTACPDCYDDALD